MNTQVKKELVGEMWDTACREFPADRYRWIHLVTVSAGIVQLTVYDSVMKVVSVYQIQWIPHLRRDTVTLLAEFDPHA